MTIADADPIFLDTNILVYASVDTSPFYDLAGGDYGFRGASHATMD